MDANPSVNVIKAKDIKDSNSDNVAQALRMTPGVMFNEAHGQRGEPSVNIRGYGRNQTGLYLDGVPIMSIYDRNTDYSQFVTQGISNIQISKGFTSPVYGLNSLGGAINLISSKPEKELEFSLRYKWLNPNERQGGVSIGTNQGKYYFQVDYSYTDRDTYPLSKNYKGSVGAITPLPNDEEKYQPKGNKLNAYYTNQTIKLKAGIQPNENHEYSLNYIYQVGEKGGLFGSRATPSWNNNQNQMRTQEPQFWKWPHYDTKTLYLLGNSYFTPNLSLNTRVYYNTFYNELDMFGRLNTTTGLPSSTVNSVSIYDDDTLGAILTLSYDINQNSNAKFGVNVKRDHHHGTDTDNSGNDARQMVTTSDLKELTTSIFAQYAQKISDIRFIIAGSYDRSDMLDALNYNNPGQGTAPRTTNEKATIKGDFSVQGILYYDFSEGQNAHLSVGKKQNMPTLRNRYSTVWGGYAPNPNLKVESAMNYEVGYDLNLGNTTLTIAGFYNDMTNMLVTDQVDGSLCQNPSGGTCSQYKNADQGYTYGGEVGVEQGFFENNALVLGVNYSYIYKHAEGLSSDNIQGLGTKVTDYPNHMFNALIKIKPIQKLEFIGLATLESARWYSISDNWSDNPNTHHYYYKNNNFFTLDISANYEVIKGLSVNAGVLNVTDRDNYVVWSNSDSHLAGRRFFVGFDYKY